MERWRQEWVVLSEGTAIYINTPSRQRNERVTELGCREMSRSIDVVFGSDGSDVPWMGSRLDCSIPVPSGL
jgi:hypothetical protein